MDQDFVRYLNFVQGCVRVGDPPYRWFFGFSTLLYYIRDRPAQKKFWGDFDVILFEDADSDKIIYNYEQNGFILKNKVVHSETGRPFQVVMSHGKGYGDVDLFFMFKHGEYIWHTYDVNMEHPRNGVISEYTFKGVRAEAFEGDPWKYTWEEVLPKIYVPHKYGTLLDIWYPGWYIPDRNFGQSRADKIVTVPNCSNLEKELI